MPTDLERIKALAQEILSITAQATPSAPVPPVIDPQGNSVEVIDAYKLPEMIKAATRTTVFLLQPGVTYPKFQLDKKADGVSISLRPTLDLPPGCIVTKNRPWPLPKIEGAVCSIDMAPSAHDLYVTGVQIDAPPGTQLGVIRMGTTYETSLEEQPNGLFLDKIWVETDPAKGGWKGVIANGRNFRLTNSRIRGFWHVDEESQAVGAWTGAGPWHIENNELTAAAENVLFGGGALIPGVRPSNLTFRLNYCWKPKAWKDIAKCKNLFELKNMNKGVIEYNVFRSSFVDAQIGHAMLLTAREASIDDITVRYNFFDDIEGFMVQLLGSNDGEASSPPTDKSKNLVFQHNLGRNVNAGFLVNRGWKNLTVSNNTIVSLRGNMMAMVGTYVPNFDDSAAKPLIEGLVMRDNILPGGDYGFKGAGLAPGVDSLKAMTIGGYDVSGNVFEESVIEQELAFPTGNTVLKAGAIATLLDATFQPKQGSPLAGKGADVAQIRKMLPWAFA